MTTVASASLSSIESKESDKEFIEFIPKLFKQHEGKNTLEFSSFDEAVDHYYRYYEEQKLQKQVIQATEQAQKKISKVRNDQSNMIKSLESKQQKMELHAQLVELYAEDIDKLLLVLNSCVDNGMSWSEIEDMVKAETAARNPIASLVKKLSLDKNKVTIQLKNLYDEESDGSDDDEIIEDDGDLEEDLVDEPVKDNKSSKKSKPNESNKKLSKSATKEIKSKSKSKLIDIEIDLSLSAYSNACQMYSNKKLAAIKESKTVEASIRSLKSVEMATIKSLESQKLKSHLQIVRKVHWFEKFHWFISSEGYLILSGRDANQNEMLVKKYMRPGDAYVHRDYESSASCVVRAKHVVTENSDPTKRVKTM